MISIRIRNEGRTWFQIKFERLYDGFKSLVLFGSFQKSELEPSRHFSTQFWSWTTTFINKGFSHPLDNFRVVTNNSFPFNSLNLSISFIDIPVPSCQLALIEFAFFIRHQTLFLLFILFQRWICWRIIICWRPWYPHLVTKEILWAVLCAKVILVKDWEGMDVLAHRLNPNSISDSHWAKYFFRSVAVRFYVTSFGKEKIRDQLIIVLF